MDQPKRPALGLAAILFTNFIWGLLPFYWHAMSSVPSVQIVTQRIVWSTIVLFFTLILLRKLRTVKKILCSPRHLAMLTLTSALIAGNWVCYITLVNTGRVLEASLSTYLSPLLTVALGIVVFKNKPSTLQALALVLVTIGVILQVKILGELPALVIIMAVSTAVYSVIRTIIDVDVMPGLFMENLISAPVAIAFIAWWQAHGTLVFLQGDILTDLFVIGTGPITAFPLLLMVFAMRNANFVTFGLANFLAPSMIFLEGVFIFKEHFTLLHFISFSLIWLALALYTGDSIWRHKHAQASTQPRENFNESAKS